MAEKEWLNISAKVSKDEMNAINLICKREDTNKNKFFRSALMEHLQPILDPHSMKKIYGIGENTVVFDLEKGSFQWSVDLGVQGTQIIADELSESFVTNLVKALERALEQKQREDAKIPKGKVKVHSQILKYN